MAPRSLASSKACRSTVPLSSSATTVPTCASLAAGRPMDHGDRE
ncbi:hypothetical protein I550_4201 [Mycobacterium intracellulare 1956]|uniref:Uncharacterized protein n=1 Tax=Mycobacterium intracellulare 1956 TaxID=1299331 RepID=X8CKR9_MYCIT|nr:hypothetical protein I548_0152 [Mycobacterium intracellulare]EUA56043.1 hypothetical protein I550_4201 [Mycobacterium intracellulare 1956]